MLSLLLGTICLFVTELHAQESVTPMCDVVAAVQCFGNMPTTAQPHTITGNPNAEIYLPCQDQINEMNNLRACLSNSLVGCDDIYADANALISQSEFFCKLITNCTDFPTKYTDSLTCITNMFVSITSPSAANSSATNCMTFSTCLSQKSAQCDKTLPVFLVDHWKLFEATCALANVSRPVELETPAAAPTPPLACPQLNDVTMKVFLCYTTFKSKVDTVTDVNITSYCSLVSEFQSCVNDSVSVCPTASTFQKIFAASMENFIKAIKPICGSGEPPLVCDTGHLESCFSNVDASMWKIENYVVEGILSGVDNTTDYTELINRAKQMTAIAKDLGGMCENIQRYVTGMENCTASQIAGCPATFNHTFQANVDFLNNVCSELEGCTNFTTISDDLLKCSTTALTGIQEHATVDMSLINQSAFRDAYCGGFNTLIKCMMDILEPCNISDSDHLSALYEMLAEDLEPICTDADFTVLQNVTITEELDKFIDCRDVPEMSFELSICHNTYLHQLAVAPTNTTAICMALTEWENCVKEVTEDCEELHEEMENFTDMARDELLDFCPRPTTPPPIVTVVSTMSPTITPNDSSGDVIDPTEAQNSTASYITSTSNWSTFTAVLLTSFVMMQVCFAV